MFFRRIAMTLIVSAIAATPLTFGQTTTTTTRNSEAGPVGLGSTETIQITVVNLASNATSGTAASCTGSISFNGTTGAVIGTATPFTVTAGQIFSASLPFAKAASSGVRTEVVGVVSLTTTSTSQAPCQLHYAVESFDTATGATHAYISGTAGGGNAGGPGR